MRYGTASLFILAFVAGGCSDSLNSEFTTPAMKDKGMIYILPGIQGVDYHYKNIRKGLQGAGVQCAIKIHPWGCQIPGIKLAVNETNTRDDRGWGQTIAQEIIAYQSQYPGRPIYLIGQSGGAGVSVFTAEALASAGAPAVTGLVLLDASVSSDYDLKPAMSRCQKGIVNFYNLADVRLLKVGTEIFGNVDGGHGDSAGRTGFSGDFQKLWQVKVLPSMVADFANPHFADTSSAFTSRYIVPWILHKTWPAATVEVGKT